ncbi:MAG: NADH-quinone oxidoreductase subunit L [Nitrososphaerota archaeon]|nr:NADH-quinone oxidoreductase subunit L [Nitrososphaerota archaeon]
MAIPYGPLAWLVWVLPLAGSLLVAAAGRFPKARDAMAVLPSLASAVASLFLLPVALKGLTIDYQLPWFAGINAGVLVDPLSVIMGVAVSWVSFLIMLYSVDYMKGEEGMTRYWYFMNFFIGSMLLIVFSDNLLQLFFGWEGVGLCSYALIGHYYKDGRDRWVGRQGDVVLGKPQDCSPSHAGMKAFITTRLADVFMLAGIFLIYSYSGTFNFLALAADTKWAAGLNSAGLLLPAMLLLLAGGAGKSAQFPFQEWLPDAMTGPAPVSALIHAAAMVKAGVFFVARIAPIFFILPFAAKYGFFGAVALMGGLTAFMGATQGMVNKELKKVLAYSTVSQIGYMMLAIGIAGFTPSFVEGYSASLFQLISHMLFKAGLFMGAGVLIHMTGSLSFDGMGGLRSAAGKTFAVFGILALSLAGVPPLSGFFSKDAIFAAATLASPSGLLYLVYALASVTAVMTAFYSLRMVGLSFFGEPREPAHRDAGARQFATYATLAVATVAIGLAAPLFEDFLDSAMRATVAPFGVSVGPASFTVQPVAVATSLVVMSLGLALSYPFYVSRSRNATLGGGFLKSLHGFFWNRWYINAASYRVFVDPVVWASAAGYRAVELGFFQRVNGATASASVKAASAGDWFDRKVVDRLVNGVGASASFFSKHVRRLQTGLLETYLFAIVLGLILLLALLMYTVGVL